MNKELTGHQILIILIGFALIGSFTGFILKSVTSEKHTPVEIEEPEEPTPPPPPPAVTLQDMPPTTSFAFDIFTNTVKNKNENIVISPYSVYTALAMIYFGAEGETKREMGSALNLTNINEEDAKKVNLLLQEHLNSSTDIDIFPVNGLFIKRGPVIKEEFKRNTDNYFFGKVDYLPETGKNINEWISEKTNNNIAGIIGDGPISPLTTSYLLSAVYFDAPWGKEISKNKTKKEKFATPNGEKEVDMMSITDSFSYLSDSEVKMISINYKNQNFSFHIIMPQDELSDFYEIFDDRKLNNFKERRIFEKINLKLPKFSFNSTVQLEGALRNMDITSALNPASANFSNIIDNYDGIEENLFIGNFLQKVNVKIKETEEETIVSVDEIKRDDNDNIITLSINNPFIFIVEETTTNTIILMGQILDPSL